MEIMVNVVVIMKNPTGFNRHLGVKLKQETWTELEKVAENHSLKVSDMARLAIEALIRQAKAQNGVLFSISLAIGDNNAARTSHNTYRRQ